MSWQDAVVGRVLHGESVLERALLEDLLKILRPWRGASPHVKGLRVPRCMQVL